MSRIVDEMHESKMKREIEKVYRFLAKMCGYQVSGYCNSDNSHHSNVAQNRILLSSLSNFDATSNLLQRLFQIVKVNTVRE